MNNSPGSFGFGAVAGSYDSWYETPVGRAYDALEKKAIGSILPAPTEGDRLLEIGCGTGHWSRFFAEEGFRVTGIDVSHEMIRVASDKGMADTSFRVADAACLPFGDGVFDVAAAITVLEFVVSPRAALQEMARCVRRGGRIIVGGLNKYSLLGIWRRVRSSETFASAKFFSVTELGGLLSEFGIARVRSVAFVVPWRWMLWAAPALDVIGQMCYLPWGDFLVGEVRR